MNFSCIMSISFTSLILIFHSCTYNVSMAHTQGHAEDVIDDTASNTPNVSPNINVPVSAVPGL